MPENPDSPLIPTPQQLAWGDAEIGVIIHLDLQVFEPTYEFRQQWGYTPDPSVFNPTDLNTDQWIEAAVAAGAKYAVLVAKHCSGFSLWPTKAHGYSVAASPWKGGKGDVVADFFQSCKKYGVRPGLYCSLSCNAYMNVDNPGLVRDHDIDKQQRYNEIALEQLTELWTNYGKLFEIWFDGGVLPPEQGGPDVAGLMRRLQPDAIVFQGPNTWPHAVRDSGNELSTAVLPNWSVTDAEGYQCNDAHNRGGDPSGNLWAQTECDIPNRKAGHAFQGGWFWRAGDEPFLYSADELVEGYFRSVGQNANLLIGMVIDNRGRFPEPDTKVFQEFGGKIRKIFATCVAQESGTGSSLTLTLPKGTQPTILTLMEDLSRGERVRKFVVEALVDEKWLPVWAGTCIGHKRIERFDAIHAAEFRLKVMESVGEPQIREFSAWAGGPEDFTVPLSLARRSKIFIGRDAHGNLSMTCTNPNLAIRYTLDGTEPNALSPVYDGPVMLPGEAVVNAQSFIEGGCCESETVTAVFGALRTAWRIVSVTLDSPYENGGTAGVAKLLDDDPDTYWHTYHVDKLKSAAPHSVVFDMAESSEVKAFTFLTRLRSLSGTPDQVAFELSADGENWSFAAGAAFHDLKEHTAMRFIPLPKPMRGRYLRFTAKHVLDDVDYVAVAGIGVVKT